MARVLVQHLRLAGPTRATEALLEEVRAVAEQHRECRVELAAPFELELSPDGSPSPERLALAARRVATALDAAPPATDEALALAEAVGRCVAALRHPDREELLAALTSVAVVAVHGIDHLDADADLTPLARVLSAASGALPPEGSEDAWVGRLVSQAAAAVLDLDDLWCDAWRCSAALVEVAASAVLALARVDQGDPGSGAAPTD